MKPDTPIVLAAALRELEEIAKNEANPIKNRFFSNLIFILNIIRRDWDNVVASRVEDITVLCDLLSRGSKITPESISQSIMDAVNQPNNAGMNLRVSALETKLDRLRKALIELHAWLESASSPEARGLLRDVWSFLERSARRNAVLNVHWF
jgi:hypothetical protein